MCISIPLYVRAVRGAFDFGGSAPAIRPESRHAPLIHLWPQIPEWAASGARDRRRRLPIDTSDTLFLMLAVAWIMHEKLTPRRFAQRSC
jgi:hypothetical protein